VPNSSYRGTLGLSSLPDSFRYLVIHPERHCLSAASSANTGRLVITNRGTLASGHFLFDDTFRMHRPSAYEEPRRFRSFLRRAAG
jgi:hypothetical protein